METNSPFLVVQNFISPLLCEQLVDALHLRQPDTDRDGNFIPLFVPCLDAESILYEKIQNIMPDINNRYEGFEYRGTEPMIFEWYPASSTGKLLSENSEYLHNKWVKVRDRDLTAALFFSDFNENPPFDSEYEVYGGKLEFPQHQFGFNPQRGTLIVYPSDPHFINTTVKVHFGDLFQVKIQIASQVPLLYNPKKFPGDYRTWLTGIK
jgi:hypothetical protein